MIRKFPPNASTGEVTEGPGHERRGGPLLPHQAPGPHARSPARDPLCSTHRSPRPLALGLSTPQLYDSAPYGMPDPINSLRSAMHPGKSAPMHSHHASILQLRLSLKIYKCRPLPVFIKSAFAVRKVFLNSTGEESSPWVGFHRGAFSPSGSQTADPAARASDSLLCDGNLVGLVVKGQNGVRLSPFLSPSSPTTPVSIPTLPPGGGDAFSCHVVGVRRRTQALDTLQSILMWSRILNRRGLRLILRLPGPCCQKNAPISFQHIISFKLIALCL